MSFGFYYDIGSPEAWVIGERLAATLPEAEWNPVMQPHVDDGPLWHGDQERIWELTKKFGLPEPRFHEERLNLTIADTRKMMVAATYAKSIGKAVEFSLAALREAFTNASPVDEAGTIARAAAVAGIDQDAIARAIDETAVFDALKRAGEALTHRVGGRTELPVLVGKGPGGEPLAATEGELYELAIRGFSPLKNT